MLTSHTPNPPPQSAWSLALLGFVIGVAASVVTSIIQNFMIDDWYQSLRVRPDFGGNGLNWLLIGLTMFTPIVVGVSNFIVFVVALPLLYRYRRDACLGPVRAWTILTAVGGFVFVVCVLFIGWGGTHEILARIGGPMLVVTLIGSSYMVRLFNAELAVAG